MGETLAVLRFLEGLGVLLAAAVALYVWWVVRRRRRRRDGRAR